MFQKSWKISLLIIIFLLTQIGFCFSGAYEGGGLGIRAISMGGAFIGIADDWTAGYWNPAGLSQLEGKGVGFTVDVLTVKSKDSNSIANGIYNPPIYPDTNQQDMFYQLPGLPEPLQFNKKNVTVISYLPGFGIYSKIKGDFTVEASIYAPVGYASEWKETISGVMPINAIYEELFYIVVYNASVARKIYPNLSVGVGINILQGQWQKEAQKTSLIYNYKFSLDGAGTGYEGVFGVLYNFPWQHIKIGGVYRTGAEVSLEGKASLEHTLLGLNNKSDYTQKFNHPATYGIGLVYNPLTELTLSVDLQGTDWTKVKEDIDFDDTAVFSDSDKDLDWKQTNRFRIGGEYRFKNNFSARLGFFTDSTPVPDEQVSLTNVLDVDLKNRVFTVSCGLKLSLYRI